MDLSSELNTNVYVDNENKIMRIFAEIESIIPPINTNRKRMINIRFFLRKNVPVTKWKKIQIL